MTRDALLAARDGAARAAAELTGAGPNAPPDEMLKRNQLIFNDLLGWLLDDPDKFVRSTVVEVCGLESATGNKLNGLRAVVKLFCAGAERYTVQFEDKTLGTKKTSSPAACWAKRSTSAASHPARSTTGRGLASCKITTRSQAA